MILFVEKCIFTWKRDWENTHPNDKQSNGIMVILLLTWDHMGSFVLFSISQIFYNEYIFQ